MLIAGSQTLNRVGGPTKETIDALNEVRQKPSRRSAAVKRPSGKEAEKAPKKRAGNRK